MSIFKPELYQLTKRLSNSLEGISNGYKLDDQSQGRLAYVIADPNNMCVGIGDISRKNIAKRIISMDDANMGVAYRFTSELLDNKLGITLPRAGDSSYKHINTYGYILEDLISSINKKKLTQISCIRDNINNFNKAKQSGYYTNELLNEKVDIYGLTYNARKSPIVRVSFRKKTDRSFVDKIISRMIPLYVDFAEKEFDIISKGGFEKILGSKILNAYMNSLFESGECIYSYLNNINPNYLPIDEIQSFKNKVNSIFPVDRTGVKIVTKNRDIVEKLAADLINKHEYNGYRLLIKHSENNLNGEKDSSITLVVGENLENNRDYLINTGMSGIFEIKIISLEDEMNAELGEVSHITYKEKKTKELKLAIENNSAINEIYNRLNNAFHLN